MSRDLAYELSIWNMIIHGKARQAIPTKKNSNSEKGTDNSSLFGKDAQTYLVKVANDMYKGENPVIQHKKYTSKHLRRIKNIGCIGLLTFVIVHICQIINDKAYLYTNSNNVLGVSPIHKTTSNEGFEVTYPYTPHPYYGKPVHSTLLLNDTFGHSWGHPSLTKFSPPKDIKFNKIVLTLNTSVDHVQYDRLAHLYVGGAEVWRTSTIEPSGRRRFSSFKKDVSTYLKLFEQDTDVLFQLDNVVTDRLKGIFDIQLYADFFYVDKSSLVSEFMNEDTLPQHNEKEDYKIFSILKPADGIYPLVERSDPSKPPLKSLPNDKFKVILPKVSTNTTRLRLSIFTSGNGNEEFWYTNVLDKFTDSFKDHDLLGHGPSRFVNVYFNGKKIASEVPQHTIFTGGISPALWNPVVSLNAFDLKSIDIDLTTLLPLLWHSNSSLLEEQSNELAIDISNGSGDTYGTESSIGLNWLTSANLLTYENGDVADASGTIDNILHNSTAFSIGIAPPFSGFLQQTVVNALVNSISSNLNFRLKNGKTLHTNVLLNTTSLIANVQEYTDFGETQSVAHAGINTKLFNIENSVDNSSIHTLNTSYVYPLALNVREEKLGQELLLNVTLDTGKYTVVELNGVEALRIGKEQKGLSEFFVNPNGNHGTGKLKTEYNLTMSEPLGNLIYKRVNEAENGTVLRDEDFVSHGDSFEFESDPIYQLGATNPLFSYLFSYMLVDEIVAKAVNETNLFSKNKLGELQVASLKEDNFGRKFKTLIGSYL